MSTLRCLSDAELENLLLGKIDEHEASRLQEHLLACPQCEERASSLAAVDRLVENVQAGGTLAPPVGAEKAVLWSLSGGQIEDSTDGSRLNDSSVIDAPTSVSVQGASPFPAAAAAIALHSSLKDALSAATHIRPSDLASDWSSENRVALQAGAVNEAGELGRVGDFRVLSVLGQGGMGVVFLAEDTHLQRLVALKAMKAGAADAATAARFLREARAAAKFQHPNLATIFAVGQAGETPYISMELLKGPDLDQRVRSRGPLAPRDAAEAIRHAARGLQHAHFKGVIHRDVKPSNLMYGEDGVVKVLDLGVARISDAALEDQRSPGEATQKGMLVGTLNYMAPEQALDPTTVDERADVFALGGVLHFLLTGSPPYPGLSRAHILEGDAPTPTPAPTCPPALTEILRRMLAIQPSKRYRNMGEVVAALDRFLNGTAEVAPAESTSVAPKSHARGRLGPAVAGLAVAGLAALVAAVVLPFWPATDAEPADQAASRIAARSSPGAASPVGSSMSIGTAALLPREVPEATGAPAVAAASGEPAARVEATSETGQPAAGATKIPTSPALAPLPPRFPARAASWPVGATENVLLGALPAPTTLPDGRRWQVVTASPDARITGLSWNADGRRLACAVGEQVRIYEGATLKLIGYGLTQHGIRCLAWSPEGDRLAALLNTGDVLVWDDRFQVQTTIANQLPYKENFNARLAWTPDGKTVVYALAGHGVVKIDDVAEVEGSSRLTLKAESEALMGAAVSPDGSQVATGSSNGRIRIWGRDGSLIREFPASGTGVLSWSPDGKWIVALATHGSPPVQLWQPDGTPGAVIPHAAAAGVMWRPDSQEFVTVGLDAVTHVWKATGEHVGEVGVQMAGWLGAYSPKGDMFVFAAGSWLHVVDVRESLQTRELAYRAGLDGGTVSWSNEGSRIACGCEHSSVAVWREDGGIDTHFGTLFAGRFAWQREQPTLAYAANWRAGVSVWSGVEGKSVCWGDDGNTRRRALAWSPDGRLTVGTPGELKTWSAPAKMDVSLAIGAGLPMWAAWRPDGSRLAAISDDQSLRIWSAEGDRIADFAPPPGDLWRGLEWSRDGGRLAVLRRNAVALYDPNGVEIGVIQDVDHVVNSISWSHDDRAILGSTSSHAVRIWDVESRGPIGGWKRAGDAATGVSCDPRGPRAAAIQSHGIMHVHNTDDGSVQWVGVLTSHNAFTLSPAGELLAGDREKADLELSCVLEQSDGTFEVYSPSEFEKLVAPHFQAAK